MGTFDFLKARADFDEPMARNILIIGENFSFEDDKPLLKFKWNSVFSLITEENLNMKIKTELASDTRGVITRQDLEGLLKIDNQFDHRNLNYFSIGEIKKDSPRQKRLVARDCISRFATETIKNFGRIYFVGCSENSWFETNDLLDVFQDISHREHCIVIDGCQNYNPINLREKIETEGFHCFLFIEERLVDQWIDSDNDNDDDFDLDDDFPDDLDNSIYINKKLKMIPHDRIASISSFAKILNYNEMNPLAKPKYLHPSFFASFLKNNTLYPKWYAYSERYCLRRYFQEELINIVNKSLQNPANFEHRPILLHGQSGTGKSVALGQLAYDIFHEKVYPVIYITNPYVTFNFESRKKVQTDSTEKYSNLSNFIEYLQDECDAKMILLIWDCSGFEKERENYLNLYRRLRNRGLNVVLVGTNYSLSKEQTTSFYDITAQVSLTEQEKKDFRSILKNKARLDMDDIDLLIQHSNENNFLAILYSLFWEIRDNISHGIYAEFRHTIKDVLTSTAASPDGLFGTLTGENLKKFNDFLSNLHDSSYEQNKLKEFAIYVAMTTYFNMSMSLDMIYGLLSVDINTLIKVLRAPMFIAEEQFGYCHYRVRSRLEAEMILKANGLNVRSIDKRHFVVYLCKLLYYIETGRFGRSSLDEVIEKVTRIIQIVGPNSKETLKWGKSDFYMYAPCIIYSLSLARATYKDPRLLIQELSWTREFFSCNQYYCERDFLSFVSKPISYKEFLEIINTAREDDEISNKITENTYLPNIEKKISDGIRFLQEEECADYNLVRYFNQIKVDIANSKVDIENNNKSKSVSNIKDAIRMCEAAFDRSNVNSYSYALTAWIKAQVCLLSTDLSNREKQEILAETIEKICSSLQQNSDLANNQYFIPQCREVFQIFDSNIELERFAESLDVKPTAAMLYVCAFQDCLKNNIIVLDKKLYWNDSNDEVVEKVYNTYFNENYTDLFASDSRCLNLQMRLYWLLCNKKPLVLSEEKQHTKITLKQWEMINEICEGANYIDENQNTFYLRFVRALAQAQLGNFDECNKELSSIRQESSEGNYDNLNIPKYLLCNPDGSPIKCKGEIQSMKPGNKSGQMRISINDRILSKVYFNSNNLLVNHTTLPSPGQIVNDICIGIGYMGICATRG